MKDMHEKVKMVTQICGDTIRTIMGGDADFIIIPIIETDEKTEVVVISNMKPKRLCLHLGMAAQQTIEKLEPDMCKEVKDIVEKEILSKDLH